MSVTPFLPLVQLNAFKNLKKTSARTGGGGSSALMNGIANAFAQLQAPGAEAVAPENLTAQIQGTPGYQFAVKEGTDSILNNASALGLRQSGVTAGDLGKFVGGNIAFPAFQDYMNRLAGLSGAAQTTSSGLGSTIGQLSGQLGLANSALIQAGGNAQAAGQLGQANAWGSAIGGIADILGDYYGKKNG